MQEVWKVIPEDPNYEISNHGRVRNSRTDRIMRISHNEKGYCYVNLRNNSYRVHRLVAMAFIPNPYSKPEVNHIDSDKDNNQVSNLEWNTSRENKQHAIANGLFSSTHRNVKIRVVETGDEFVSQTAAALGTGVPQPMISQVLSGKRKRAHGLTFERIS